MNLGARRGSTNGSRFLALEKHLIDQVELGVELIAAEQILKHHKSVGQAAMAHGLQATLEKVAAQFDLEIVSVDNSTLKKHATDFGHAKKPTMARALIDRYPQLQGQLLLVKPGKAWITAQTSVTRPARKAVWVYENEDMNTFACRKHSMKPLGTCACPDKAGFVEKFGFDPYGQAKFKGICPELVADLEAVPTAGKIPDAHQVAAIWVAHWTCANYAVKHSPFAAA